MLNRQLFDSTRGRIVTLLRSGGLTADDILAIESLVAEIVGAPVHECCDRSHRPQCCFEIGSA